MRISMNMRTVFSLLIALFLVPTLNITTSNAQDSPQWHLPDGARARLGKGSIHEIAYSPDGSRLAVGSSIGIWVYDANTGAEVALIGRHASVVSSVAFSPDGTTLATGSTDLETLFLTGNPIESLAPISHLIDDIRVFRARLAQ